MDIRPLSDSYAVSPQINPSDVPAIAEAGYTTILCNRPDQENPPDLHMCEVKAAAEAAGLTFHDNPFDPTTFGPDCIARQKALLADADGPVFAYCASGNRCSIVWAFTQAGHLPTEDIIAAIKAAGYQADHLRGQLAKLAEG